MASKRIIVLNDTHCGSRFGLTPEGYRTFTADPAHPAMVELSDRFNAALTDVLREKPADIAFMIGDMIDGEGRKSQGTEQTTTNPMFQVDAAREIVRMVNAPRNYFIMGTAYHTGQGMDYEAQLARDFNAPFEHRMQVNVNGLIFDLRHHTGRSSIPYGMNAVEKEKMWNSVLASYGKERAAHIFLRGHIHWYRYAGAARYLVMSLPALQYPMTKYGARCTGDYDMGFVYFDVDDDGGYSWTPVLFRLAGARVPEYTA